MSTNWPLTGGTFSWRDLSTTSCSKTTVHDNYYEELKLEKEKLEETRLNVELLILKSFDKISSIEMLNLIKMLKSSDPENNIVAKAIIEKFNKELFA
jgi:hypothetical protein